jgi:uncharacterized protein DUF4345
VIGGYVSSSLLAASGVAGILIPDRIASVLDTTFSSTRGRAELRIVYGALAALGGCAVAAADHELFVAVGVFWLGAAAVRLLALTMDRPRAGSTYWAFLALELVLGFLGVLGSG